MSRIADADFATALPGHSPTEPTGAALTAANANEARLLDGHARQCALNGARPCPGPACLGRLILPTHAQLRVCHPVLPPDLADWTGGEYDDVHRVKCVTRPLDHLIAAGEAPRPDFVKCDVEGAELKVLAGARATLDREDAPTILFEANVHTARGFGLTVSSARDFLAALARAQYRFFEVGRAGALTPSVDLHPVHSNLLAVPASRSI